MSEREHTVPAGDVSESESGNISLAQLTELTRQAYEQKRTKNCLDLIRAILLIDPENAEAQLMRSSIRMEMHLDLNNARSLLKDVHLKDRPQKYSEAGTTVLRRILSVDPDSEEARTLLSEVSPSEPVLPPPAIEEQPVPEPVLEVVQQEPDPPAVQEQPTVVMPARSFRLRVGTLKRPWIPRAIAVVSIAVPIAVVACLPALRSSPNPINTPVTQTGSPQSSVPSEKNFAPAAAPALSDAKIAEVSAPVPVVPRVDTGIATTPPPSSSSTTRPTSNVSSPPALAASGKLAISSPTSVDVYVKDEYIGSAPVTIEMSPGAHTLEYRHENLRKSITHTITTNETTRAAITFDVPVQINARPWADVYVDGIERKPLGQTPMSGVQVPIGGVLVFENSQFGVKRYRVTGRETAIQIVFP